MYARQLDCWPFVQRNTRQYPISWGCEWTQQHMLQKVSCREDIIHLLLVWLYWLESSEKGTFIDQRNNIENHLVMVLCCTMACFHVISISLISSGDHPCAHYFYVPWLIMTSQWVMTFLGMPHCGTMGNDFARDVHCDITMDSDVDRRT